MKNERMKVKSRDGGNMKNKTDVLCKFNNGN